MSVVVSLQSKMCTKCGEVKLLDSFHSYTFQCKVCVPDYQAKYRAANPEETLNIVQRILKNKLHMSGKGNGLVYILRDAANKALKIGFTINLTERLKRHRTSNPFLTLVDTISNVTISLEGTMHSKLIFFRVPGTTEWYRDDAQVLALFADYKMKCNPQVLSLFADYKIKCKLESDLTD